MRQIDVMDTTLRDGAQCADVRFTSEEKALVVSFLAKIGVKRFEVASANVPGEEKSVRSCLEAASVYDLGHGVEVLSRLKIDDVDWVLGTGCVSVNLLAKSSLVHCERQIGSPSKHFRMIEDCVRHALDQGARSVRVYLEDWSQGCLNSPDYVAELFSVLTNLPVTSLMLCDTLGVFSPWDVEFYIRRALEMSREKPLEFHGHNDYGLAVANTLTAIQSGASVAHVAINGLGERAGNAPLDEVVVGIRDHLPGCDTAVDESQLTALARCVSTFSGRRLHPNKPVSGRLVFTNAAGIHIDGDRKGGLYVSRLHPKRFERQTEHPLGPLGGGASVKSNLEALGYDLPLSQIQSITNRVAELSKGRHRITQAVLCYLVAEELNRPDLIVFRILPGFELFSRDSEGAIFKGQIEWQGCSHILEGKGVGPLDAFMSSLRRLSRRLSLGIKIPVVVDYDVDIPPGGKSDAIVEAIFEWTLGDGQAFTTTGLSKDSSMASIRAAEAAINIANRPNGNGH